MIPLFIFLQLFSVNLLPYLTSDFTLPEPQNLSNSMTLWATWYYLPQVESITDGIPLRDLNGNPLGPKLSKRNWCDSAMEGSVRVSNVETNGVTYNYAGKSDDYYVDCTEYFPSHPLTGKVKFRKANGPYGDGVSNYYLLPYRTIAVDKNQIPYGTVIYIPSARGTNVILPDGIVKTHDGYFFAGDTGGAITGTHIDVFIGNATSCPFSWVGSSSSRTFTAYKITDQTIINTLKTAHTTMDIPETHGTVSFLQPQNGNTVLNPVIFKASKTGDVKTVKYFANDTYLLGESSDEATQFNISYQFQTIGLRNVSVKGYDSYGNLIDEAVQNIEITIVNELCSNECSLSEKRCNEDNVEECILIDGCYKWNVLLMCSHEEGCLNGECGTVPVCHDDCLENALICEGNNVAKCGQYDDDSCFDWGVIQSCNSNESCLSGVCVNNNNECPNGCQPNEVCNNGNCIPINNSCTDECIENETRCYSHKVEICARNNETNCTKYITQKTCENNEICANSTCMPKYDEDGKCSVGVRICNNDTTVFVCNNDGGEFVFHSVCSENEICNSGFCYENTNLNNDGNSNDNSTGCNFSQNNDKSFQIFFIPLFIILFIKRKTFVK